MSLSRRSRFLLALVSAVFVLVACGGTADQESPAIVSATNPKAEPDPTLPPPTDPTATAIAVPTESPEPVPTSAPNLTATPIPTATPEPTATQDRFSFALIVSSEVGILPFIDLADQGTQQAVTQLGVQGTLYEATNYQQQAGALRAAGAAGFDLIVVLSLDTQMVLDIAREFQEQLFGALYDLLIIEPPDNLAIFQLDVHESSFLIGLIAGMMTETKVVGAVIRGERA